MPQQYALFFTIKEIKSPEMLELNYELPAPHGIRRIFQYLDMYICILNESALGKRERSHFTPEEIAQTITDKGMSEIDQVSKLKTNLVIKPIIEAIFPQIVGDPDFKFRWALVSLNAFEWPAPPTTIAELFMKLEGADGGGNG